MMEDARIIVASAGGGIGRRTGRAAQRSATPEGCAIPLLAPEPPSEEVAADGGRHPNDGTDGIA
jgi:hypothetical protein